MVNTGVLDGKSSFMDKAIRIKVDYMIRSEFRVKINYEPKYRYRNLRHSIEAQNRLSDKERIDNYLKSTEISFSE